jgi:ribosomal protein S18 acetylase RimI-like enzyme
MATTRPISFDIRPATAQEPQVVAMLHVAAWRETYRGLMPDGVLDGLNVDERAEMWARTLVTPEFTVYLAINDNAPVGFACCAPRRTVPPEFDGEFVAIYVLARAHGSGVGRALMRQMAQDLNARGMKSAALRVAAENTGARRFYEHIGGIHAGSSVHRVDDADIDEVMYGWHDLTLLV